MLRDSVKRCMPTFSKPISEDDPLTFCFEWLWYEHAALAFKGECKYCDVLPIKLLHVQLAFFKEERATTPSLRSWDLCINLAEAREAGPSLSLVLSPDREVLAATSDARGGTSLDRPEDTSSLASAKMEIESATSRHSSHKDKAFEDLLNVVTWAVARPPSSQTGWQISVRWPMGKTSATVSPLFGNLNDKLTHPSRKPYSSHVFVPSLTGYLSPGSTSSLKKPTLPTKHCRVTSMLVGKEF